MVTPQAASGGALTPIGAWEERPFGALPGGGLDNTKCIKMALVHDLGESLIGDIVRVLGPLFSRVLST